MSPDVLAAVVEGTIVAIMGAYCTALGYGLIGKKPGLDPRWDLWREKSGSRLKVLGPLIVAFGFFLTIKGIVEAPRVGGPRAAADPVRR